ncbi:hypothetical protein JXD20_04310 [Candidatus Peregrinibacteria bacterium]|nr:hypothetical protein [Candidatus Peregrinibacteria bacterium]
MAEVQRADSLSDFDDNEVSQVSRIKVVRPEFKVGQFIGREAIMEEFGDAEGYGDRHGEGQTHWKGVVLTDGREALLDVADDERYKIIQLCQPGERLDWDMLTSGS